MFLGLRPLEVLWLLIALVIIGQQIIVRDGVFDPVAFAAAAFFIGLTLALAFAYLGARIGLRRFYVLAGFSLLLGAAGSWLNLTDPWSAAFIFGLEGLAGLVCGALVLRHYLRSTRPLAGEDLDE